MVPDYLSQLFDLDVEVPGVAMDSHVLFVLLSGLEHLHDRFATY